MIVTQRWIAPPAGRPTTQQHPHRLSFVVASLDGLCDKSRALAQPLALAPVLHRVVGAIYLDADTIRTAVRKHLALAHVPERRTAVSASGSIAQSCSDISDDLQVLGIVVGTAVASLHEQPHLRDLLLEGADRMAQHRHRLGPWSLR